LKSQKASASKPKDDSKIRLVKVEAIKSGSKSQKKLQKAHSWRKQVETRAKKVKPKAVDGAIQKPSRSPKPNSEFQNVRK